MEPWSFDVQGRFDRIPLCARHEVPGGTTLGMMDSGCPDLAIYEDTFMEIPETRFAQNGDVHLAYQTVGGAAGPPPRRHVGPSRRGRMGLPRVRPLSAPLGSSAGSSTSTGGAPDCPIPFPSIGSRTWRPRSRTPSRCSTRRVERAGRDRAQRRHARRHAARGRATGACGSLVLFAATARTSRAGCRRGHRPGHRDRSGLTRRRTSGVEILAPSRVGDQRFERHLARLQRLSVRPGAMATTTARRWRPTSARSPDDPFPPSSSIGPGTRSWPWTSRARSPR